VVFLLFPYASPLRPNLESDKRPETYAKKSTPARLARSDFYFHHIALPVSLTQRRTFTTGVCSLRSSVQPLPRALSTFVTFAAPPSEHTAARATVLFSLSPWIDQLLTCYIYVVARWRAPCCTMSHPFVLRSDGVFYPLIDVGPSRVVLPAPDRCCAPPPPQTPAHPHITFTRFHDFKPVPSPLPRDCRVPLLPIPSPLNFFFCFAVATFLYGNHHRPLPSLNHAATALMCQKYPPPPTYHTPPSAKTFRATPPLILSFPPSFGLSTPSSVCFNPLPPPFKVILSHSHPTEGTSGFFYSHHSHPHSLFSLEITYPHTPSLPPYSQPYTPP